MNIYLIRHSAVYNPNKLCYGQSEIPLEENFTADFDWIKEHLNLSPKTLFYSSPFRRCTKMASFLSDHDFIIDKRLSELNFGDWEMKPWDKIPKEELDPWMLDFVNYTVPNGENFLDLAERAIQFFEDLIGIDAEDVVIITHAGIIRSFASYILDFPLERAFNLQIDYSSISKIQFDIEPEDGRISYLNLSNQSKVKTINLSE
ncbi:MAG: alpha-ribazole phosphatase [Sphingobacteriales bacterium]|nr:alpha-ribazole phosphatase [Sphingobacteriales bacterium]